jgi:xanthine dehydrogenase accessory factor
MNFIFDEFLLACQRLREDKKSFVIATLIDKKNSVPQDIGSKVIITSTGIYFGTIGGGSLEKECVENAQKLLEDLSSKSFYKEFNLNKDLKMTCGGSATIFFEKIENSSAWEIIIFGAGHISQALCRTLINLDCSVICVDTRKEWLDKLPKNPKLTKIFVNDYTNYLENISYNSYIVIMTSGHKYDYPILKEVLKLNCFPYVGVIGSKTKRAKFDFELKKEEIKGDFLCPIGEKIGTNNPFEIAISITTQLLKYRDIHSD